MNVTMRIIERGEARYETKEFPFGRTYQWHPAYIVLEYRCGEKVTLTKTTSTPVICRRCGADHSDFIHNLREQEEGRLQDDAISHPWLHDSLAQADQHLRDEATYPKGSPWRYNDVTSR